MLQHIVKIHPDDIDIINSAKFACNQCQHKTAFKSSLINQKISEHQENSTLVSKYNTKYISPNCRKGYANELKNKQFKVILEKEIPKIALPIP